MTRPARLKLTGGHRFSNFKLKLFLVFFLSISSPFQLPLSFFLSLLHFFFLLLVQFLCGRLDQFCGNLISIWQSDKCGIFHAGMKADIHAR